MYRIDAVVQQNWARLMAGEKIDVPVVLVEHPANRPDLFKMASGWPFGQTCDYVWRLGDNGRVHAQCFTREGQQVIRIHRDRWDPENGLIDFAMHAVAETPVGFGLGIALFMKALK